MKKNNQAYTFTKIFQNMIKRCLALVLLAFISTSAFSYDYNFLLAPKKKKKTTGFDKTRLLLGPGLGFSAGYRSFYINISPTLAYSITNNFYAGVTASFSYYQQTVDEFNVYTNLSEPVKYKLPIYSTSIFARYIVGNFFLLNVQPELNNLPFIKDVYPDPITHKLKVDSYRRTFSAMLLGVGYVQRYSERSHGYALVNYDLLQNPNLPYYQSLDVRAGIMIQLFN
jgi:hypothetical protein